MMSRWEFSETELWRYGGEEYSIFHVFSVCSIGQNVFVFAEGRRGDGSDADCPHDIVLKRSLDGGKTFLESVVLLPSEGKRCLTNPCPLYDEKREKLFLFFSENLQNQKTRNFYITTADLGESWSEPVDVSSSWDGLSPSLPFHLAGPGHGICVKNGPFAGRLLMQFWHRSERREAPVPERGYCADVLYSDDGGESWKATPYLGQKECANECRLAETKEGLFWSMRTRSTLPVFSESLDGGVTWGKFSSREITPARCCDMGCISLSAKVPYEDMVLLSRVSHPEKRRDMEILISTDGGKSFPKSVSLMAGDAMPGYSDLCVIDEDEPVVGLVHCRNNHVLFSRISLQTLTGGEYENTSRSVWLK